MRRAIVVLSGGQDSTTCLFYARKKYDEIHCVTFDYGQRHRREIESAKIIAKLADVGLTHEIIAIPDILKGTSPLVNKDSELEQYKDHASLPGGLEKTFVPMRNQLFLTIAANRAICTNALALVTGICQEDFGGYPDCRQSFVDALQLAIARGTAVDETDPFAAFHIDTPLMDLTKAASVKLALEFDGCYGALGFSHTSYDGAYPPLGHDHATLLRAKGFEQAGVPDPLIVRAYWEKLMDLPETDNYKNFAHAIVENAPGVICHGERNDFPFGYAGHISQCLERVVHAK